MKPISLSARLLLSILLVTSLSFAQGETAVPFLLITSSVEGNGMGGISAAIPTDNAMSVIANPGQLGLLSLKNFLAAGIYTEKTMWLPQFHRSDLAYNTSAVNAGISLDKVVSLPFPVSLGVGYSRIFLNLGEFIRTGPGGPEELDRIQSYEKSENFSLGVGLDRVIKAGLGVNFKSIESKLGPLGTEPEAQQVVGRATAIDLGIMVQFPATEIISKSRSKPLELVPKLSPLLDITMGYARSNVGDEIKYLEASQLDPLPRNATLGLSLEAGLTSTALTHDWKVVSFTWARQAEDVLVKRYPNGSFKYQGWLGEIEPFKNIFFGKSEGKVTVRRGWQLQVAEILVVRGGSFSGPGYLIAETNGYTIALNGLFKLLEAVSPSSVSGTWIKFLSEHVDLQFHSSNYGESPSPISGTSFKGLNLVIR